MEPKPIELSAIRSYLERRTGEEVLNLETREFGGEATGAAALKQFGYGNPLLVTYETADRQEKLVFHRIRRNAFGRERADDRVAAVWLDFETFNQLPRHVRAVDKLARTQAGDLHSIAYGVELMLVTLYTPGDPYAEDLIRIRDRGEIQALDLERAEALAVYLAGIHQEKHDDPLLWQRRLRDLVGHGEGIMGITDSYPLDQPYTSEWDLREIEVAANRWRWRLKPRNERLRQVHGDFHPFNVLFTEANEFKVLDRSRGAWGDPADDVSCMTINYIFFSLQRSGRLEGAFQELHKRFWESYMAERPDQELNTVIQPWFAWRALVLASPVWYPTIDAEVRRKLLTFARKVLQSQKYDYTQVNAYLEAGS